MKLKIRVKRPEARKRRDAFDLWNHDYQAQPGVLHVQFPGGNPHAKILVLVPVPSDEDYACGTVFNDAVSRIFKTLLRDTIGLDLHDCLIAPCVREGAKALKGNTRDVMKWVQTCVEKKMFKLVICIGSDAAKWIVNGGKKANIGALAGQLMYPRELNYTPLFIFPDVKGLIPEPHPDRREMYWREQAAIAHGERLGRIALALLVHLRQIFPQGTKKV